MIDVVTLVELTCIPCILPSQLVAKDSNFRAVYHAGVIQVLLFSLVIFVWDSYSAKRCVSLIDTLYSGGPMLKFVIYHCRVYLDLTSLYTDLISFHHICSFLLLETFLLTLTLEVYPFFKVATLGSSLLYPWLTIPYPCFPAVAHNLSAKFWLNQKMDQCIFCNAVWSVCRWICRCSVLGHFHPLLSDVSHHCSKCRTSTVESTLYSFQG